VVIERFFQALNMARIDHGRYATRDQARADVLDYINRCYDPT